VVAPLTLSMELINTAWWFFASHPTEESWDYIMGFCYGIIRKIMGLYNNSGCNTNHSWLVVFRHPSEKY